MVKKEPVMNKQLNNKGSLFFIAGLIAVMFMALVAGPVNALTDTTHPTIDSVNVLSVSPADQDDTITNAAVMVKFSEPMDESTINGDTFIVKRRTTAADASPSSTEYSSTQLENIDDPIRYDPDTFTATFMLDNPVPSEYNTLQSGREYGVVDTVMITTGVKDLAGNSLSRDYVYGFTTDGLNGDEEVSPAQPEPVAAAPPAPADNQAENIQIVTSDNSSNFPWMWVIGGLIFVLLAILILALVIGSSRQKDVDETGRANPFGDVHPVMDLEGIGPEHKKELQSIGIDNTRQLWEADAAKIAKKINVPLKSVKSWQHMAELASVTDIGPQYSELLERSGVHTIGQLKKYDPNKLLNLVRKKQNSIKVKIQGNIIGYPLVENWIKKARNHRYPGFEGQAA
ncbi:MAG: DUF4332 domain-containing protein [Candidatus Woesearchaeota archaeon]